MVILAASGNVGIGDSSPASLFTVGTSDAFQINSSGNVSTTGTLQVSGNATFDTDTLFVDATNDKVGIGNATPDTTLDVSGTISRAQNSARIYKNAYIYNNNGASQTGTLVLTAPKAFSSTMLRFTIKGYDYSSNGAWEVVVSGYAYSSGPSWLNTSTEISGSAPFTSVRLGSDGTYPVIMLGTTSTVWQYPKVVIEEIVAGYGAGINGWGEGWSGALVTDEATPIAYSSIVTPTQKGPYIQGGNSFGTTATLGTNDSQNLVLETNNTARLTFGATTGAATFSGTLTVTGTTTANDDILLGSGDQLDFTDEVGDKAYWYSNTYGTGIESGTLTNWSGSQFRWRTAGTDATTGTERMLLTTTGLTLAGTLAVNGDSISADGATLTINAAGAVDIQDAVTVDSLIVDSAATTAINISNTGVTTDINLQNGETI